jgi:hypothetical protein
MISLQSVNLKQLRVVQVLCMQYLFLGIIDQSISNVALRKSKRLYVGPIFVRKMQTLYTPPKCLFFSFLHVLFSNCLFTL